MNNNNEKQQQKTAIRKLGKIIIIAYLVKFKIINIMLKKVMASELVWLKFKFEC